MTAWLLIVYSATQIGTTVPMIESKAECERLGNVLVKEVLPYVSLTKTFRCEEYKVALLPKLEVEPSK